VRPVSQVVLVCLGLLPGPALAYDWSLSTTLSQTFELNDNQFMRQMLAGGTLGSYTTVGANAVVLTPTSQLTADGNVGYRKYWGPGTDGIAQTESDWLNLHAHYETWGKNRDDKEFLNASFQRSSTVVAVLGDLGVLSNVNGDINRSTLQGGLQRSLSALDTLSFSASSTLTTYDPAGGGTQFTDTSATGTWRHKVDPLTTVSLYSQLEWLYYDTTPAANLLLWRNTAGFETTLSPVLTYGVNAGAIYGQGEISGVPQPFVSTLPAFLQGSAFLPAPVVRAPAFAAGSAAGFIGDAHAIYRITKSTTFNLFASQTVAPAITGALTKRTTLHAGMTHLINFRSSISVAGDVSRQTASGTTNDFLSGSVSYSYELAKEWHASLTYRYLHRTAASGVALFDPITGLPTSNLGPASSNSLMVTVSNTQIIKPLEN
jgi:hypothetical protein